ncbi:hypothetical protein [Idiomarina sp.]|jgi:methylated-DNA-[protein]-cysteine S-methyltransferase|uniref:methylated-DNA--[protein]-cysteine S-methyltransferase n=1 Tax=Idiomarina TaxID=135575 RepID=UPI00117A482A
MYYSEFSTPLGRMYAVADNHSLLGLYYQGQKHCPDMSAFEPREDNSVLRAVTHQIHAYFSNSNYHFDLPLRPQVTDFQKRVLSVLSTGCR